MHYVQFMAKTCSWVLKIAYVNLYAPWAWARRFGNYRH
jgi:hypothetical protein